MRQIEKKTHKSYRLLKFSGSEPADIENLEKEMNKLAREGYLFLTCEFSVGKYYTYGLMIMEKVVAIPDEDWSTAFDQSDVSGILSEDVQAKE